jgi:hypothetical protein
MDKKSRSGSRMNIPDHISESLETIFRVKILKFFDRTRIRDPVSGIFLTLDPGPGILDRKKFGSGINIPDSQHCKFVFKRVKT